MPLGEIIIGIGGFKTISYRHEGKNIIIKAKYTVKPKCPYCECRTLRLKDTFIRSVRHGTILTHSSYLEVNLPMKRIYYFKQKLASLMLIKSVNKIKAKKLLPKFLNMIEELKHCNLETLETLGNTLDSWKAEIVRMWRFTKTNSITEGFHTKMEMISRRAFGFRNFENYRLRARALCA